MDVKEDVGSPRDRLLKELQSTLCKEARAEAAEFIPQWDDELLRLLSTEKGGLAAIAIVERELDASFRSRGSKKPAAVEDIISNQEGTWARSWYDAREEVLKLGAVANASVTFCDEPAIRKRLEYADFICGLLLAVACDFSYGVADATVRAANV